MNCTLWMIGYTEVDGRADYGERLRGVSWMFTAIGFVGRAD